MHTETLAFAGDEQIAFGSLSSVAAAVKDYSERDPTATLLVFDAITSERIELDLRGTRDEVLERLPAQLDAAPAQDASPGRGRPKLGVIAREVTLLPRHWDWLNQQSGGASVALRKLVDEARRANAPKDRMRQAQESAYRFLSVMAGDRPGFEEVTRALFAGNRERFESLIEPWPAAIREHTQRLTAEAFPEETAISANLPE